VLQLLEHEAGLMMAEPLLEAVSLEKTVGELVNGLEGHDASP
jgi:hypothetical protein